MLSVIPFEDRSMSTEELKQDITRYTQKLSGLFGFESSTESDEKRRAMNGDVLKWFLIYYVIWHRDEFGLTSYFVRVLSGGRFKGVVANLVVNAHFIGIQDGHHRVVWQCPMRNVIKIQYQIAMITVDIKKSSHEMDEIESSIFQFRGEEVC